MDCPRCTQAMETLRVTRHTEIDWCPACGGAWYQAGELERALKVDDRLEIVEKGRAQTPGVQCPACGTPTAELTWPPDGGVRIDACSRCGGRWLDKGELEAIRDELELDAVRVKAAQARSGQRVDLPVGEIARKITPAWVGIGALVMLLAYGLILAFLSFGDLFSAFSDTHAEASGGGIATVAGLLAFVIGGFVVGRGSPGFTIWEPGLAAIPAAVAVVLSSHGSLGVGAGLGLAIAGVVLAVGGGVLGERLQTG